MEVNLATKGKIKDSKTKKPSNKEWFLSLGQEEYRELCSEWRQKNLKIPTDLSDYDQWLNYFKELPPSEVNELMLIADEILSIEACSALKRWADIYENPSRIDKIYQAGLAKPKTEQKTILDYARENNELAVLKAARDNMAEKLEKGTGARDTASLVRELCGVMELIDEIERRQGPSDNTLLGQLIGLQSKLDDKNVDNKPKGARKGSYKAKTIKEMEANGE